MSTINITGKILAYRKVQTFLLPRVLFPSRGRMQSSLLANRGKRPSSVFNSIVDTIGETPIIKLQRLNPEGVNMYVKLESENPGGSVKDRLALGAIEWAEKHGHLKPGQTVVEASSGNTGIGLAMVCATRGYPFVCVMSEAFSIERRKLMRFLGAKVILTNPAHKATGMVIKAKELADTHGYFWVNQFENEANAWIHEQTTGPEILDAMEAHGTKLDHFVCTYGTGGTLKGVGKVLRERSPDTKIYVCEPDNAPMLYSKIKTEYPADGVPSPNFKEAHPVWRPHLFQGWAADFIPKLVDDAVNQNLYDNLMHAGGEASIALCKELAIKEGIFSGTSGGGVLLCALELAKKCNPGESILAMIPDTGERYLSTPLFDDIPADMTEEEKELANSTPSTPPPPPGLPGVIPEATDFVKEQISAHKVLVFSLEYCEFCWTLFKLFDVINLSYETINIDSMQYASHNMGNKYRAALSDITGCNTFPQFFIDGKFIGGAADACIMWKKGELQPILEEAGLKKDDDFGGYKGDPFEFLPKCAGWVRIHCVRDN